MNATTTDHIDTRQVLALATPELYRKNLFRVLGIPVTATVQEARRRQKKLDMARKLGANGTRVDGQGLLALREPGENDIRVALERLTDPKSRLLDEIFWFWPTAGEGTEDPGLAALERGDVQGALNVWRADSGSAEQEATKAHNRALLNHLIALDLDAWFARSASTVAGSTQDLDSSQKAVWKKALAGWRGVLDSEPFWQRAKRRVEELGDPQLTLGTIHRLREILPQALLSINARIALDAAERGDEALANTYVQLLREGAPDTAAVDNALHAVLQPIRHRIQSLCEQATKRATDDIEHGNDVASDLLEQPQPLLRTIDLLLDDQDVLRSGTHDAVAEAIMKCLIAFGNKTEDWSEVIRLLDVAIPVAEGEAQRTRMEESRKQAEYNRHSNVCYFCGKEKPDPEKAVKVKMHGDVQLIWSNLNSKKIQWRHTEITVPRCTICSSLHQKRENIGWRSFLIGLLVTIGLFYFGVFKSNIGWGVVIGLFFCFGIGLIAMHTFAPLAGRKGESNNKDFPPIKDLLAKGWKFGEQPNTN